MIGYVFQVTTQFGSCKRMAIREEQGGGKDTEWGVDVSGNVSCQCRDGHYTEGARLGH